MLYDLTVVTVQIVVVLGVFIKEDRYTQKIVLHAITMLIEIDIDII